MVVPLDGAPVVILAKARIQSTSIQIASHARQSHRSSPRNDSPLTHEHAHAFQPR